MNAAEDRRTKVADAAIEPKSNAADVRDMAHGRGKASGTETDRGVQHVGHELPPANSRDELRLHSWSVAVMPEPVNPSSRHTAHSRRAGNRFGWSDPRRGSRTTQPRLADDG